VARTTDTKLRLAVAPIPALEGASVDLRKVVLDKAQELTDMALQRAAESVNLVTQGQLEIGEQLFAEAEFLDDLARLLGIVAGEIA